MMLIALNATFTREDAAGMVVIESPNEICWFSSVYGHFGSLRANAACADDHSNQPAQRYCYPSDRHPGTHQHTHRHPHTDHYRYRYYHVHTDHHPHTDL